MKKRVVTILLALCMTVVLFPATASAADDKAVTAAESLHTMGLFNGVGTNTDGTPDFDLNRAPTREEAVTMLVRLLGKEAEAKAGSWTTPFTDVADWAKPYVGYAYENGLANGTGATTFSGNQMISASQYLTFVLRALGYDDSAGDFTWNAAWELSDRIGLTNGEYDGSGSFLRGDVAIISLQALGINFKNSDTALYSRIFPPYTDFIGGSSDPVSWFPEQNDITVLFGNKEGSAVTIASMSVISATINGVPCETKTYRVDELSKILNEEHEIDLFEHFGEYAFCGIDFGFSNDDVLAKAEYAEDYSGRLCPLYMFELACVLTLSDGRRVSQTIRFTFLHSGSGGFPLD